MAGLDMRVGASLFLKRAPIFFKICNIYHLFLQQHLEQGQHPHLWIPQPLVLYMRAAAHTAMAALLIEQ